MGSEIKGGEHLKAVCSLLRCPISGEPLHLAEGGEQLLSEPSGRAYRIDASGIPRFAETEATQEARIQEAHYDVIAKAYVDNLFYPHTQEYMAYLDQSLDEEVRKANLGVVAEICCGAGEAFSLYRQKIGLGIGVDISINMLKNAQGKFKDEPLVFVQGDATRLPLADASFDTVFILGGIHHVNDRNALFAEVARILKPGGRFIWREPVSDFWLWRGLRAVIYRLSPMLDHSTERPLLLRETITPLQTAGLELKTWKTIGFLGFCLFMNSDVLYFNRLFRFVPFIRSITKAFAQLDDVTTRVPGLRGAGLIVVGSATKPL